MTSAHRLPLLILCSGLMVCQATWSGAAPSEQRMEAIAMAFVEAHNAADIEIMAAFRAAHRPDAGDDWKEQYLQFVERLGTLEVTDVLIDEAHEVVLRARSSTTGGLELTFAFDPADVERIEGIGIDRVGPSADNDLPELNLRGDEWSSWSAQIDGYLARLAEEDRFSGAVLVGADGDIAFERAYGLASREFAAPNGVQTRFDIGSITKDFTRVAVAQLIAEGRLGLDDKLGEHLPDYPNPEARAKVTVRQLFEHSSGIGDYFTEEWRRTPMGALREHQDYIAIWGPKPLEFEPGTDRSYSNFGFTLLGAIIEKVSGQPYFEYVAEKIFAPAGMEDSGFFAVDQPIPNVAVGYTKRGSERTGELRKNIYLEPAVGGPWGKTYSTARDLWRFWQALSHHRLTPSAYTRWVLLDGPPPVAGAAATATATANPVTEVGLGGGGPGLSAELVASDGHVLIVLANLDPPVTRHLAERLQAALTAAGRSE